MGDYHAGICGSPGVRSPGRPDNLVSCTICASVEPQVERSVDRASA
jgi:hypothetical protein